MGRFLARLVALTLPGTLLFFVLWIGLLYQDAGRDLGALARLAPVQCNAMIFGTSRSAQGINPMVIEAHLEDNNRWFNFSFNLTDSPWCEAYSQAIQQKVACSLDATGATTLILCVDPWSMDEVNADGGEFWTKNAWCSPCDTPPWRYALANSSPLDVFCYGSKKDLAHVIVHFVHVIRDQLFNRATLGLPEGIQASGWLPNNRVLSEAQRASAIKERVHFYEHEPIGTSWPGRQNAQALPRLD